LIDRLVAALGARALVQGNPRMGWLMVEIAPAMLWTHLTGALSLEGYNLVLYLTLLGATTAELAWLPLVTYAGIGLHVLVLLVRPMADAKADCVRYTALGRAAWFGTVLWPLLAWWLGCGTGWVLGGVFACILLTALIHNAGIAAFMTWTQAVVPPASRGRFFAWRNLFGFIAVWSALHAVAWAWPEDIERIPGAGLPWLMGLFSLATVVVLIGTVALWWSPGMPLEAGAPAVPPALPPLRSALRGRTQFRILLALGMLNTASAACSLTYLPRWLSSQGMDGKRYATLQGDCQVPLMLLGILLAGMLLRRLGGARLLTLTQAVVTAGDLAALALDQRNLPALAPLMLALSGLGRGLMSVSWIGRLQELVPARDTRFPMLHLACSGAAGACAALALLLMVPSAAAVAAAAPAASADALASSSAATLWWIVALGALVRALALPLSLVGWRRGD
jgi:hypothetical protein